MKKGRTAKIDPQQLLLELMGASTSVTLATSMSVTSVPQPGGAVLLKPGKVQVEGSVRDARKALGLPNDKLVIRLIQDGKIQGWKPRKTGAGNCKWRVNMQTVYALKDAWNREAEERA